MVSYTNFCRIVDKEKCKRAANSLYRSIIDDAGYKLPAIYQPWLDDIDEFYESEKIRFQGKDLERKKRSTDEYDYGVSLGNETLASRDICLVFYWFHRKFPDLSEVIERKIIGDTVANKVEQFHSLRKRGVATSANEIRQGADRNSIQTSGDNLDGSNQSIVDDSPPRQSVVSPGFLAKISGWNRQHLSRLKVSPAITYSLIAVFIAGGLFVAETRIHLSEFLINTGRYEYIRAIEALSAGETDRHFELLSRASEHKYAPAIALKAVAKVKRLGTDYDLTGAKELVEEALFLELNEQFRVGDAYSSFALSQLNVNGLIGEKDYPEAIRAMRKAYDGDHPRSGYELASLFYDDKGEENDCEGRDLLEQAVQQGVHQSRGLLARYIYHGRCADADEAKAMQIFMELADAGDADGQFAVGVGYERGFGFKQDHEKAVEFYLKAVAQGDPRAMINLGLMHQKGIGGLAKSNAKGFSLFQDAAKTGNADAQSRVGDAFRRGEGTKVDIANAKIWFELSADQGYSPAQTGLGYIYLFGPGEDYINHEKALYYTRLAEKQGNASAQLNLGYMHQLGLGGLTKDIDEALRLYGLAAEQNDTVALNNIGKIFYFGQSKKVNYNKAFINFKKSSDLGDKVGQYFLGEMYRLGLGVDKNLELAFKEYCKSASQGDIDAQNRLGYMYRDGKGTNVNDTLAIYFFQLSARQGKADSYAAWAWMLQNGRGVDTADELEAERLYKIAAKQDVAWAQSNLGSMYLWGNKTVKTDYKKALYWFERAEENGSISGLLNLGDMFSYGRGVDQDDEVAEQKYLTAAESGDADARYRLARFYEWSDRPALARKHYEIAANKGHVVSKVQLGLFYEVGIGVEIDLSFAEKYYRDAVRTGDANQKASLGRFLLDNYEGTNRVEEAIDLLNQAYADQSPFAATQLAYIYGTGQHEGYNIDPERAQDYLKKSDYTSVEWGLLQLFRELRRTDLEGEDVGHAQYYLDQALKLNRQSALTIYAHELRTGLYLKKDIERAYNYYTEAISFGDHEANAGIGLIYLDKESRFYYPSKALDLCKESSKADNALGRYCLGIIYFKNIGEASQPISTTLAQDSLVLAAQDGNSYAKILLALGVETGRFRSRSPMPEAESWLRSASDSGNLDARYALARFLMDQRGQKLERGTEAFNLLNEAGKAGHHYSDRAIVAFAAREEEDQIDRLNMASAIERLLQRGHLDFSAGNKILNEPGQVDELLGFEQSGPGNYIVPDLKSQATLHDVNMENPDLEFRQ